MEGQFPIGIYGILDFEVIRDRDFVDVAAQMIRGGIKVIQMRDKKSTDDIFLERAKVLRDMTAKAGVLFIVNDRISIAKEVCADGVHLGLSDLKNQGLKIRETTLLQGDDIESVELIEKSSNQNIVSKRVNGGSRVFKIAFWPAYRTGRQGGKRFTTEAHLSCGEGGNRVANAAKTNFQHSHIVMIKNYLGSDRKIVGISTHSLKEARDAEKKGADYIGIGPVYRTLTKPDAIPIGVEVVREVVRRVKIPKVAIGGINERNLKEVLETGVQNVAMVREICCTYDIEEKIKRLIS